MEIQSLKNAILDQPLDLVNFENNSKYLNTWKTILEVEKLESEESKNKIEIQKTQYEIENIEYQKRNDRLKFWVGIIAPLVSAMALMATLLFQIITSNRISGRQAAAEENQRISDQRQRDAEEDLQWRNFTSTLNDAGKRGLEGAFQLSSFYNSDRYKNQARSLTFVFLQGVTEFQIFNQLLYRIVPKVDSINYSDLVSLSSSLNDITTAENSEIANGKYLLKELQKFYPPDPNFLIQIIEVKSKLSKDEHNLIESSKELQLVGKRIAEFMKLGQVANLNLQNAHFFKTDFSDADFKNSNLSNVRFENCNIKNANLSNAQSFQGSEWDGTKWWQANQIERGLLKYLIDYYSLDKGISYHEEINVDDVSQFLKWKKIL